MRIERSKEWWVKRAIAEGDDTIGAGLLARDPAPESEADEQIAQREESRIAFGRFINLMRRRQGMSIEKLADAARVDASELLVIEEDVHYVPGPRTVYQLARMFDVPQARLMQLAGLTAANDAGLREEAVRFAARSEAVHRLTPEESAALSAFVAVLGQQEPKRSQ
ncbi:MAG: helix-turn-helix transcriptional regulator [Sphingomonadales bacterium]|nr:helix-turn-helix transcriptional regulator [Sphingomonadales bacterium]